MLSMRHLDRARELHEPGFALLPAVPAAAHVERLPARDRGDHVLPRSGESRERTALVEDDVGEQYR